MNFIEELRWRGMLHNITPELEKIVETQQITAYLGIDPTASSLTVGNLAALMMLMHLQRAGHKPVVLVGGATGMIGDPSGKKSERSLLDEETLQKNIAGQKVQLQKLLDFDNDTNPAIMVNNYDWFKEINVLDFLRDIGKHLTVNYMMAKDSVKSRIETGISFTEFSYQLIQGYDFVHLYKNYGCNVQMGGSDQWGNITAGTELVRRMLGGEAYAVTCPLITKADGTKFGKSEGGNIWLNPELTSPYQFYQFWLNASDEDAGKFIRIFTFLSQAEIEELEAEHTEAPHLRKLQKRLAQEVTTMLHGAENCAVAIDASQILFNKKTTSESLKMIFGSLSHKDILTIFDGVPQFEISRTDLEQSINIIEFLAEKTNIYGSKGEVRRALKGNSVLINKDRVNKQEHTITTSDLIADKFILVQKGKKNFNLVVIV